MSTDEIETNSDVDAEVAKTAIKKHIECAIETAPEKEDYLSSGSTLVNFACSGRADGAFVKGKYSWIVGDSSSGKTWITLNAFAEASINKHFNEYDLILDNVEDGALMNIEKYFGRRLAERLQPPAKTSRGEPVYSRFAEDFYYNLDDRLTAVEKGKAPPFLYLLDSMDALSSKYELSKFKEKKTEARGGKKAKGDYGDGKAKINSTWIRSMVARFRDTRSILIVLGQTRDNIGAKTVYDPKQTVAGGRALKFYAAWQMWTSVAGRLTKEVNGTKRQIGINARMAIKKNRLTGKEWTVTVPIYWSSGIDDTGSLIDFLIEEKHWETSGSKVFAKDLDFEGPRIKLIRKIEEEDLEMDLKEIVREVWSDIELNCEVRRKNRYA